MCQVVTNHGDKTMPQTQAQTQSITEQQPDQLIAMNYKMTIHQTLQIPEMAQPASDAENKAIGEQNVEKRVFCNHCRSYNHDTKACRKQRNNTPSPAHSQIATGYHPTATPPPLIGTIAATQPTETHNNPLFN